MSSCNFFLFFAMPPLLGDIFSNLCCSLNLLVNRYVLKTATLGRNVRIKSSLLLREGIVKAP